MAATMALAIIGPIPGTVINWRYLDLLGDVFDTLIKTPPIGAEISYDPDHAR